MNTLNFKEITAELNQRARTHPIGELQNKRAEFHRRRRAGRDIFRAATTSKEDGAFHYGGRGELQFNIWREGDKFIRHGVAFCFKPSMSLQNPINVLKPKVDRFNKFMQLYPGLYRDMRMWH